MKIGIIDFFIQRVRSIKFVLRHRDEVQHPVISGVRMPNGKCAGILRNNKVVRFFLIADQASEMTIISTIVIACGLVALSEMQGYTGFIKVFCDTGILLLDIFGLTSLVCFILSGPMLRRYIIDNGGGGSDEDEPSDGIEPPKSLKDFFDNPKTLVEV